MRTTLLPLLVTLSIAATSQAQVPRGRLTDSVKPTAYKIEITVLPEKPGFHAHVEIALQAKAGGTALYLHGRKLQIKKAQFAQGDGAPVSVKYVEVDNSGVARIDLPRPLEAGSAKLLFDYDASFGAGAAGLYRVKVGPHWYAWTQLEAIDARTMFPSFDQPEFKTPYTISVLTGADNVVVSNEAEIGVRPQGGLLRHDFATTEPLPTYLVALAVGPFDVVESSVPASRLRDRPLPLRVLGPRGQKDSLVYALDQTKPIVNLLEAYFDRPFPYSKLDQIASPVMGGAMENAGAIIYDDTILMLQEGAPVPQLQDFGMVVAHEISHQWFGDLVTPVWWEDIWLNESFANWLGYRIASQWKPELNIGNGALKAALKAMDLDALSAGRPIQQPIRVSGEIDSAFDPITYGKGGKVIEMVEAYLGPARFQKGVRLHMQRFARANAASSDFFQSLADAAAEPRIVAAMHGFVEQQGVPVVRVERSAGALKLSQSRYAPLGAANAAPATLWTIPFCVRSVARPNPAAKGGEARQCTLLDQASGSMPLPGNDPKATFIPNEGGHGYYRFSLPDNEWKALIALAPQLAAGEALAIIDSLWAQWTSGNAALPLVIQAARAFASHSDPDVATDLGDRLSRLRIRGLLAPAQLPAYQQLQAELYATRLQKLGFDPKQSAHKADAPDTQRLRATLVHTLAIEARSAPLTELLAKSANAWMEGDDNAVDRAFLTTALTCWLDRKGLAGAKRLLDRVVASTDMDLRERVLRALAEVDDPNVASFLLANLDKRGVHSLEKIMLVLLTTRAPHTRQIGIDWLAKNLPKLSAQSGLTTANALFSGPSGLCSQADADRSERSLRPHVSALQRGDLSLTRAVEEARNCGALLSARGQELLSAFPERPIIDATLH